MRKIRLVTLIITLTVSCNFLTPNGVLASSLKRVDQKPAMEELLGSWEVDSFSYDLIKENYDLTDQKVILTLKEDRTFMISNLPDFDTDNTGMSTIRSLNMTKGIWVTKKNVKRENWYLNLAFEEGVSNEAYSITYFLFEKDEELIILN